MKICYWISKVHPKDNHRLLSNACGNLYYVRNDGEKSIKLLILVYIWNNGNKKSTESEFISLFYLSEHTKKVTFQFKTKFDIEGRKSHEYLKIFFNEKITILVDEDFLSKR